MKLTIIIPVFNEKKTIKHIISKVISVKSLKKEIIIVNPEKKKAYLSLSHAEHVPRFSPNRTLH